MFTGFSDATIDFMWQLRFNNNKTWFEAHKTDFIQDFQTPMKALALEVFEEITSEFDRGFRYKVSRIYKDARRVKGGDPYRTNLWFSIERPAEEWTGIPVFWFELAPEEWSYGLGYYAAKAETMTKFRARLDKEPKTFETIIAPLNQQGEFVLSGDEYKRKKNAPTEKTADWYNRKSFSMVHKEGNSDILYSHALVDRLVAGYKSLMPLYDYLIAINDSEI